MGIRFTFHAVQRDALAELADASLEEIARRAGWPVRTELEGDDGWLQLGPLRLYGEGGPPPDPAQSFRALSQHGLGDALGIVEALAQANAWPSLRLVQEGYRRWWIAGLIHPLRPFERDRYDDGLEVLARMVQPCRVQIPWFDARIQALVDAAPWTLPVLRVPSRQDDSTFAEVDPEVLAPLLDWADTVRLFPDPLGRDDGTDWDAFVRQHLRVLRSAGPGEILLTELA